MLVDEGLEILDDAESMRLLASADVGRIGLTINALPAIFPVNFRVIDGSIVFRSAPGSKLRAAAHGAIVAFEADEHDPDSQTGWSVLVVGPAEIVHDMEVSVDATYAGLVPYADGPRPTLVRVTPTFVSGRRIVHGLG